MKSQETPVLIVGGGPVGLALSNELGWRGIAHILLERTGGEVLFPAGEGIFSRTMEHLRRWGLADRARFDPGFPSTLPINVVFATSLRGRALAVFEGPSNGQMPVNNPESPEGIMICPKQLFDPLLRAGAQATGHGDLRYGWEMLEFSQDAQGVLAKVRSPEGELQEIRAGYLAACDGARSAVRKTLGIPYIGTFGEGHNFAVSFRAPALEGLIKERFGRSVFQLHTLNTPRRPYFTTVNGSDHWRMSMYVEKGDDPEPLTAVKEAIGEPIEVEIIRAQPWAGHRVVAQRYRHGRVFLLGDAAHLRWPKGGFGANTGIGDAVDLGWKLAATIEGWAGPKLLDSYEAERRPIAIRNVNEAANNRALDAMIAPDPGLDQDTAQADALRAAVGNRIHALRLREFRTQGVQLGYRYRQSPICIDDGSLEPPDDHMIYQPSTWPGGRAPHARLQDGRSTLDLFGRTHVLLRFDGGTDTASSFSVAARKRGLPLVEHVIADAQIARLYEKPYVLVRPDGHVAWRGDDLPQDALAIIDRVRGA
jgi:2-polyprenyl-6-methoxyphenol hydroxylase-like FAD-dependent oxidoreductase